MDSTEASGIVHRLRGWLVIIGLVAFMAVMFTLRVFVLGFAAGPLYGFVPIIIIGVMIAFFAGRIIIMRRHHRHGSSGDQQMMPMMGPMAPIMLAMQKKAGTQASGIEYETSSKKEFSDTLNSVSKQLAAAGLAVVGRIDLQKELKERRGAQIGGLTIIDAISPNEAVQAIETNKDYAAIFPWRVVVQSAGDRTLISLHTPLGYSKKRPELERIKNRFRQAIDAATLNATPEIG